MWKFLHLKTFQSQNKSSLLLLIVVLASKYNFKFSVLNKKVKFNSRINFIMNACLGITEMFVNPSLFFKQFISSESVYLFSTGLTDITQHMHILDKFPWISPSNAPPRRINLKLKLNKSTVPIDTASINITAIKLIY